MVWQPIMTRKKNSILRVRKNLCILAATKQKIEQLAQKTGFFEGQIVDFAITRLKEKDVYLQADNH